MKYFGKKSLSSWLSVILHFSWYVTLVFTIIAPIIALIVILFSTPLGDQVLKEIAKSNIAISSADFAQSMDTKEAKDWEEFKKWPLAVKLLILPYLVTVMVFLLQIIKKSQQLFTNFKNDIVFNKSNVQLISKISKLLIIFSIITFSFSSLLISIVLLLFCEIIKNGTVLQEEQELTV